MTTTAVIPSVLTWEQFLELLDEPEYKNAELVDGQVIVNTRPGCTNASRRH